MNWQALPLQPKRQAADDAFIIGVGRKNQYLAASIRCRGAMGRCQVAERQRGAVFQQRCMAFDELSVRIVY